MHARHAADDQTRAAPRRLSDTEYCRGSEERWRVAAWLGVGGARAAVPARARRESKRAGTSEPASLLGSSTGVRGRQAVWPARCCARLPPGWRGARRTKRMTGAESSRASPACSTADGSRRSRIRLPERLPSYFLFGNENPAHSAAVASGLWKVAAGVEGICAVRTTPRRTIADPKGIEKMESVAHRRAAPLVSARCRMTMRRRSEVMEPHCSLSGHALGQRIGPDVEDRALAVATRLRRAVAATARRVAAVAGVR